MRIFVWVIQFPIIGFFVFYLFAIDADAPRFHAKQNDKVDRSIAALQESFFDKKLQHYEYCYGVKFFKTEVEANRRRACKAMLVHKLDNALSEPGTYLTASLQFRCQGTGGGLSKWENWRAQPVYVLKPNHEMKTIDQAITKNLAKTEDDHSWQRAYGLCKKMQECKRATQKESFSWVKVKSCLVTLDNDMRRVVFVDYISRFFRTKPSRLLMAQIINQGK